MQCTFASRGLRLPSKRTSKSVALIAVVFAVSLGAEALALDVVTDASVRYQVMEGWGTALWGETSRDPRFRAAYRDAGMNLVRLNMAKEVLVASPNDYATPVPLGSDLQVNVARMNFRPNQDLIAKAEFAQWLGQNALEPDRVKLSASPWTPPHWMKGPTGETQNFVGVTPNYPTPFLSNMVVPWQQHNPIPTGDSVGGRLKTENADVLRQYGEYLAAWVTGFEQEYGVPIHAMSLQNESTYENPFDSMTFIRNSQGSQDFNQYALALKSVKNAWAAHALDVKVMGPHVAHFGDVPSNPYGLWWQNEMIRGVKNHADPDLIDFLDFYNANYYNGTSEGNVKNVAGFYHGWQEVAPTEWTWHRPPGVKNDGKGIWFSEAGGDQPQWLGSSGNSPATGAISVALDMFNALVHANASAYEYWQFSDGGASVTEHTLLNGATLNDPLSSNKYAAFKHFSRYVRPGAVRIDSSFANGAASTLGTSEYDTLRSVNVSSFLHEEDQTLTYVILNMTGSAQPLSIDLPDGMAFGDFDYFRSSETERFAQIADLQVQNNRLTISLPRYSVITLVGGVSVALAGDFDGDGDVDGGDFLSWQRGASPNPFSATDLNSWRAAFGAQPSQANGQAVPEPAGVWNAAGLLAVFAWRGRTGTGASCQRTLAAWVGAEKINPVHQREDRQQDR